MRIVKLPTKAAKELRKEENVAFVQRVWLGEPLESWDDEELGSSLREEPDPVTETLETNLTWTTGQYAYDGSGNIKQIGDDIYRYDSAGRLIQAVVKGTTETYKYDAFGNLTEKAISGVAKPVAVDPSSNRVKGEIYDAAGNVTTRGGAPAYTYSYDSFSMMDGLAKHAMTRRMIYGPEDERIGVIQEPGLSRWKIRDFGGKVLREFRGEDEFGVWVWMEDYVHGEGRLIGRRTSAGSGIFTPTIWATCA